MRFNTPLDTQQGLFAPNVCNWHSNFMNYDSYPQNNSNLQSEYYIQYVDKSFGIRNSKWNF